MDISGKKILVTGAASGLGAATADYLSQQGADIIRVDKKATQKNIYACDVTSPESVKTILDQYTEIHGVVNCAGIVHGARIVGKNGAMPLEDFLRLIQINFSGRRGEKSSKGIAPFFPTIRAPCTIPAQFTTP